MKGILEKKDFDARGAVFLFVAAFDDHAAGYSKEPLLTALCHEYANVVNRLLLCH